MQFGIRQLKECLVSLWDFRRRDTYIDDIEFTVDKNRRLAYLVLSKAACSSIKATMIDREAKDRNGVHLIAAYELGMRRTELDDEEEKYFKFTFVRNPFDRIVSCYVDKFCDHKRKPGESYFDPYLYGVLADVSSFEQFVSRIRFIPARLMDRHMCPQYLQVYKKDGTCRVDHIGHFESLENEFRLIQDAYGLGPLRHYSKSGKRDYREYYTVKTARMVYRKYRKDFRAFGYEDSYKELINYIKKHKMPKNNEIDPEN